MLFREKPLGRENVACKARCQVLKPQLGRFWSAYVMSVTWIPRRKEGCLLCYANSQQGEKHKIVSKHLALMLLNVIEKKIIGKIHSSCHIFSRFFWVAKKTLDLTNYVILKIITLECMQCYQLYCISMYVSYGVDSPPSKSLAQLHWLWVCGSAGWSMRDLADGSWANCCVNSRPSGWLCGLNGLCQMYRSSLAVHWSRMALAGMIGIYLVWSDICHSLVQACSCDGVRALGRAEGYRGLWSPCLRIHTP